jgi:hypothetical protein
MTQTIQTTREQRRDARLACGAGHATPVKVIPGSHRAPAYVGESFYYTNRAGVRINHPTAYSKKGWSQLVYHYSSLAVVVGEHWFTRRERAQAARLARRSARAAALVAATEPHTEALALAS